jgi:hypothetical protein
MPLFIEHSQVASFSSSPRANLLCVRPCEVLDYNCMEMHRLQEVDERVSKLAVGKLLGKFAAVASSELPNAASFLVSRVRWNADGTTSTTEKRHAAATQSGSGATGRHEREPHSAWRLQARPQLLCGMKLPLRETCTDDWVGTTLRDDQHLDCEGYTRPVGRTQPSQSRYARCSACLFVTWRFSANPTVAVSCTGDTQLNSSGGDGGSSVSSVSSVSRAPGSEGDLGAIEFVVLVTRANGCEFWVDRMLVANAGLKRRAAGRTATALAVCSSTARSPGSGTMIQTPAKSGRVARKGDCRRSQRAYPIIRFEAIPI